ncbi:phage protein DNA packaging protein [Advenella kashmirensis WT001]|uniref:Phage protein DNA packaging protein n=1 Tax=Advenella kashmirensis (strain DSM 17095 / LMG 22695 / WT001) TaxID=1036672 RepID=I3UCQ0_ADVKW|nr:head-tail connector protein [Advenella kashmirensis]AFK62788.1 phage protein DNA packaging protein [Advenella kashmirensis WT001]
MVDVTQAKEHMRVDHDFEDTLIQTYIDAATAGVLDYLNLAAMPIPTPAPVTAAILLAVGDLYENRESKIENRSVDNLTYKRLLDPYRAMDV